jgi:hypothetical protein
MQTQPDHTAEFGVQMTELEKVQTDWQSVSDRLTEMCKDLADIQSTLAKAAATDLAVSPLASIAGFGIAYEVLKDVKDIESRTAALLAVKQQLADDIAQDAQKIAAVKAEYAATDKAILERMKKADPDPGPVKAPPRGTLNPPSGGGGSGGGGGGAAGGGGGADTGGGRSGPPIKDGGTGTWQTHTDSRGWDGWSTSGRHHPRNGEGGGVITSPNENGLSADRKGILDRALERAQHRLGYSQSSVTNGYRVDCSGLVSDAWGLPGPGLNTIGLMQPGISHEITKGDLQPGDAMIADDHTVIFGGWADASHTHYIAIEDNGSQGCISHVIPYPYYPGSGPYQPYRRNGVS